MTEEQIERTAERAMDVLDAQLMSHTITQAQYDEAVRTLDKETTRRLGKRRAA